MSTTPPIPSAKPLAARVSQQLQANEPGAALETLAEVTHHHGENHWTLAQKGEALRLLGRNREYEKALADFNRALALQPDYLWAKAFRARTHGVVA